MCHALQVSELTGVSNSTNGTEYQRATILYKEKAAASRSLAFHSVTVTQKILHTASTTTRGRNNRKVKVQRCPNMSGNNAVRVSRIHTHTKKRKRFLHHNKFPVNK